MLGGAGAFTSLARTGWMTDVFFNDPTFQAEWEEAGIKVLVPAQPNPINNENAIMCSEPVDDFAGKTASVSGQAQAAQAESLGLNSSSLPWNEQYEALQRGVIDCAISSMSSAVAAGYSDIAPHVVLDSQYAMAMTPTAIAFSLDRWNELPLVAQQLLYDRLDVFYDADIVSGYEGAADLVAQWQDAGGGVREFTASERDKLAQQLDELVADAQESGLGVDVSAMSEAAERWADTVLNDLPYEHGPLLDFVADFSAGGWDSKPFTDLIFEKVLGDNRPS